MSDALTGCQVDTPPGVALTPTPCQADTPPPVSLTPQEGNTGEGNTLKERIFDGESGLKGGGVGARCTPADASGGGVAGFRSSDSPPPCHPATPPPSLTIAEVELTNRQAVAARQKRSKTQTSVHCPCWTLGSRV